MAPHLWPPNTPFRHLILEPDPSPCVTCGGRSHICSHRHRTLQTLKGPLHVECKLTHGSDPGCASRPRTWSPTAEMALAPPRWTIGWDVFVWLGYRRFTHAWSIPQLQAELADTFQIHLSVDALEDDVRRYPTMVAARQQDLTLCRTLYEPFDDVLLTIDGLQPEKGYETLYVVRERRLRRGWFAKALLSSAEPEIDGLFEQAKQIAQHLGEPVRLWMSDKQAAFVHGVSRVFPGVEHRYGRNHVLRDAASKMLEADRHANVQRRRKVRGLRELEREAWQRREEERRVTFESESSAGSHGPVAPSTAQSPLSSVPLPEPASSPNTRAVSVAPAASIPAPSPESTPSPPSPQSLAPNAVSSVQSDSNVATAGPEPTPSLPAPPAAQARTVGTSATPSVLNYGAAVRGILNDDQGGPLRPPGWRMAAALVEVKTSLSPCLEAKKGGSQNAF